MTTDLPDGQISRLLIPPLIFCPAPLRKIFRFRRRANHLYKLPRPDPQEGRCATSSTRVGMRWTRMVLVTRALVRGRRSRVVLTPRRRRQVSGGNTTGDGDKKARSPGRARRKPLKPFACGNAGRSGFTCSDYARVLYFISHARLRVQRHPAFPTPSLGGCFAQPGRNCRRGNAKVRRTHSSCPGLTRASINLRKYFLKGDGLPGQARQ